MSASDYNDGQAQETKGCRDRSRNIAGLEIVSTRISHGVDLPRFSYDMLHLIEGLDADPAAVLMGRQRQQLSTPPARRREPLIRLATP